MDLCEECAQKKGVTQSEAFSLTDILAKTVSEVSQAIGSAAAEAAKEGVQALVCPHCGMTPADYKRVGRLGCPDCYENLKPMIAPMLAQMQHANHHSGKAPQIDPEKEALHRRLAELHRALDEAVRQERYEDAARLRDELAALNGGDSTHD